MNKPKIIKLYIGNKITCLNQIIRQFLDNGYWVHIKPMKRLRKTKITINSMNKKDLIMNLYQIIEKELGITGYQLTNCSRKRNIIDARMIASKIYRYYYGYTYFQIGNNINRHYSSIINYLQNFDFFVEHYPEFKEKFDKVKSKINMPRFNIKTKI